MTRNPRLFETRVDESPGGVIFPITDITLRDLFAAFALAGLLADKAHYDDGSEPMEHAPSEAFEIADAMLAEREKRGEA